METTQASESSVQQEEVAPQQNLFADVVDTEPYEKSMKNARIWLYIIAALQAVMGIFEYYSTDDPTIGLIACGIDFAVAFLFLGLALYSKKNPVMAFTSALISYIVIVGAFMALDPSNIFKGLIVKVFVVIALVKANKDARKYVEIKQSIGE